ncbi:MAG: purine-nucleoside phosphorylase [Thomasclavelia sp.]
MYIKINEATDYIKSQYHGKIDLAIILGSGLGHLVDAIKNPIELDYRDIPHFPISNLAGHAGKLVIGSLEGKTVIAMKGRFHYYEGNDMSIVTLPIRVFKRLGIEDLILTNASGGIRDDLNPGQLMLIKDHISLFMESPLRGPNLDEFGPRFTDMSETYNQELRELALKVAKKNNISLTEGVYAYAQGPMYETPAEIQAFKVLGGDAVGMSTVPEAVVANHCGMKTLGISLITNKAAGLSTQKLNHEEVIETANKAEKNFTILIKDIIKEW